MWKFFGLDKLSDEQLGCISDKGNKVLNCLSDCKSERCRYKCTGKLVPDLTGCLKIEPNNLKKKKKKQLKKLKNLN